MKILYNGGLFGNEALCYQGREIVKQLAKDHTVKFDFPEVDGYWGQFFNSFEGPEDVYVMNGHIPYLTQLTRDHKRVIPISVFETKFPKNWVDALNLPGIPVIWTISDFCKQLMINSGVNKPIDIMYLGLDERFYKTGMTIFKDKSFKFLNVSAPHCLGNKDRKGLDVLIRAFKEEFGDDPHVTLLLKINTIYADTYTRQMGRNFDLAEYLKRFIPKGTLPGNISVITDYFPTEQINLLYNSIDCGVFPSRAEGFGLPQAELIKIGKPVITTNYSSTNEFSDPRLRINTTGMEPLDYNVYPYGTGLFAEPDITHLRKLMRQVYENYKEEAMLADKFKPAVARFTWENVRKRMNDSLNDLDS